MIYVTSDLHGWPLDMFRGFLKDSGFGDDDFLFVLGDVIDRNGDGGIEMLRWIMYEPNVEFLCGNHEDMMLQASFIFNEITDKAIDALSPDDVYALEHWMRNGAAVTIESMRKLRRDEPGEFRALLGFVSEAPIYDSVSLANGEFLLVHGGIGNFSKEKRLDEYEDRDLLWYRPKPEERFYDDIMTVVGHTPTSYLGTPGRMFKTDTWVNIDTGAAGGGDPMLLRLDDMREFYVK